MIFSLVVLMLMLFFSSIMTMALLVSALIVKYFHPISMTSV